MTHALARPSDLARSGARLPWLDAMVMPTLVVLAVVVGYPVIYTLLLSTQEYNLLGTEPARFVGSANYHKLFDDPIFWQALRNTALYTFGSVAVSLLLGLAMALLTDGLVGRRGRFVRALLLTPWAVPFVVVAFLFRYMYLQNGGAINALLLTTGVIATPISWLNVSLLALPAVMVANIWAMTPFFFLIMSAAIAAIPNEVIESARIDRAGALDMIFRIKLPFLRNALLVSSLLMIIANFNDFAKIWAMTQGGPGYSTTTLVIYVYRQAFENFSFGYASAVGVVWLLLLLVFAVAYLRALARN
ncbi:MAG TPA: sugar ABC transporter permease [Casimicrobiaceae bacterium]|nr:sugar ABC transporter permease [Casimicrobiaceae bacterium]